LKKIRKRRGGGEEIDGRHGKGAEVD